MKNPKNTFDINLRLAILNRVHTVNAEVAVIPRILDEAFNVFLRVAFR